MTTPDFRKGLILLAAATKSQELFWRIAARERIEDISEEDRDSLWLLMGDMVAIWGYSGVDKPTILGDCLEHAMGYLKGFIP
jgi:hypothetical protein